MGSKVYICRLYFSRLYTQTMWGSFFHGETVFLGVMSRSGILTFRNSRQDSFLFIGSECFFKVSLSSLSCLYFSFCDEFLWVETAFYLLSCPTERKYSKDFSLYFTQMLDGQNPPCFGIFLWIGVSNAALDIISIKLCKI